MYSFPLTGFLYIYNDSDCLLYLFAVVTCESLWWDDKVFLFLIFFSSIIEKWKSINMYYYDTI